MSWEVHKIRKTLISSVFFIQYVVLDGCLLIHHQVSVMFWSLDIVWNIKANLWYFFNLIIHQVCCISYMFDHFHSHTFMSVQTVHLPSGDIIISHSLRASVWRLIYISHPEAAVWRMTHRVPILLQCVNVSVWERLVKNDPWNKTSKIRSLLSQLILLDNEIKQGEK